MRTNNRNIAVACKTCKHFGFVTSSCHWLINQKTIPCVYTALADAYVATIPSPTIPDLKTYPDYGKNCPCWKKHPRFKNKKDQK